MQILEYKGYRDSLLALRRRGGSYQKAYEKAILYADQLKDHEQRKQLPVTNHGETRISKAVKYDLGGRKCRLVTIQDSGYIFLCFAGTHDDTDKWLNKNRGLIVSVDAKRRPIAHQVTTDYRDKATRVHRDVGYTDKALMSHLSQQDRDAILLGLPFSLSSHINEITASIADDEIEGMVDEITDTDQKNAIFDIVMALREDNTEEAVNRVRAYTGELQPLSEDLDSSKPLADSKYFQTLDINSDQYRKLMENYARNANYKEWMLFMHPEQNKFVDAEYAGPAKLVGVSGSGKTAIIVRRAISLAGKYPDQRILILTLNRSLARLIADLVDTTVALPEIRSRVDVLPFFTLCQEFLGKFEPNNTRLYDDTTWKSKEHIDEIWREYYRCENNNHDARVLQPVHDSLIARGIDAEQYIRDEFAWIRSATVPGQRNRYLKLQRTGRQHALDASYRKLLLEGLEGWEKKMQFVGVTDYLGIANALYIHIDKLSPKYRCILVDESQDFGTIDFHIIRKLTAENPDDIFLCGDAAQKVSAKHQSFVEGGISIPGARSSKLVLNYRNSRQILEVAEKILEESWPKDFSASLDFEILKPEYANFGGPTPIYLSADSLAEEVGAALTYAREQVADNRNSTACLAICGFSEYELQSFAQRVQLPLLNGETDFGNAQIIISDLDNTKGFEFQYVIILNCSESVIPNPTSPPEENFRELSRLYVAMTRARHQLLLSGSGKPSQFLTSVDDLLAAESWAEYLGLDGPLVPVQPPDRLEAIRRLQDTGTHEIDSMTGEQYLYDGCAIGCPPLLIDKLRTLVSGKSRIHNRTPVEWRTISEAVADTKRHGASRQAFGKRGFELFHERFMDLFATRRGTIPKAKKERQEGKLRLSRTTQRIAK